MIEEAYVSFETAKLLKEKGFGGDCLSMYVTPKPHSGMGNPNEAKLAPHGRDSHYYEGYIYQCEAPTQQMAMRWLREVYNIFIVIEPHMYDYINEKNSSYVASLWQGDNYYENITSKDYQTYEEAVEAAIQYSLKNLI